MPPYSESFPVGTEVRILDSDGLLDFQRTWKYHNKLKDEQLQFAGLIARISKVGYYHGGDVLYNLENIPGTWHECCLKPK
jgi:hypothetical protein